jgi:hypothetical protein
MGLLALLLALSPTSTRANQLTLTARQPSVGAGQIIEFTGSGFRDDERVSFWATDPTDAVIAGYFTEADDRGTIEFEFRVPANAIGGEWAMTARGDRTHLTAVALFFVHGHSPASTEFVAKAAPPAGAPGTTFAFAANGFKDDEKVSYWVTDPNGNVFASYHQGDRSDENGRVDLVWTSPTDAMHGRWVMTIQGFESSRARGIPFWVGDGMYDPAAPPPAPTSTPTPVPGYAPVPTSAPAPAYRPQENTLLLPTYEPVPTFFPACPPCDSNDSP